ncbi:DUF3632 domain-containing protein [Penicillium ucsense]|uniref:DUF3632 domain-containing protein n=1 Tax=Penicillium ucsense TaxID=2839758 RepID=A0A8J8WAS1_9EURO|nr:DUF3632 domain-containing protein [Penicillium ucsense]KAF7736290.1 DUF3632 domain-containing protein [Penicillium ucsense]
MGLIFSQLHQTPSNSQERKSPLHLDSPLPSDSSQEKVFAVLADYLSPESPLPLDLAVESLLKLLPASGPDSEEIYRFGEDCFEIAEMSSYKTSAHSRLAQLLEALGLSSQFTWVTNENGRVWRFEPLRLSMHNSYKGPNASNPTHYINYNSFLAHLYSHRIFPTDPTYALWAMRAAFEDDRDSEPAELRSAWVLGAAQWILWNGQGLFQLVMEPALFDVTLETWPALRREQAWGVGRWYEGRGEGGLSLERWRFWRGGFGQVETGVGDGLGDGDADADGGNDGFSEECRVVAGRARELMEGFERNMRF